jgi:hypothetical protein
MVVLDYGQGTAAEGPEEKKSNMKSAWLNLKLS